METQHTARRRHLEKRETNRTVFKAEIEGVRLFDNGEILYEIVNVAVLQCSQPFGSSDIAVIALTRLDIREAAIERAEGLQSAQAKLFLQVPCRVRLRPLCNQARISNSRFRNEF